MTLVLWCVVSYPSIFTKQTNGNFCWLIRDKELSHKTWPTFWYTWKQYLRIATQKGDHSLKSLIWSFILEGYFISVVWTLAHILTSHLYTLLQKGWLSESRLPQSKISLNLTTVFKLCISSLGALCQCFYIIILLRPGPFLNYNRVVI